MRHTRCVFSHPLSVFLLTSSHNLKWTITLKVSSSPCPNQFSAEVAWVLFFLFDLLRRTCLWFGCEIEGISKLKSHLVQLHIYFLKYHHCQWVIATWKGICFTTGGLSILDQLWSGEMFNLNSLWSAFLNAPFSGDILSHQDVTIASGVSPLSSTIHHSLLPQHLAPAPKT